MAVQGSGYATGADRQNGELRQRGAPELEINGKTVQVKLDKEDKKKLKVGAEVVRHCVQMLTMDV
jgi:hypothetical protein